MPWYDKSLEDDVKNAEFREAPADGIALLIKVAEAFSAVHAHGYAHRDGKPANILVRGSEVALADFGLCLQVDDDAERLTAGHEAVGSRLYIAPENESGMNEDRDQRRADFYAFGKILWAVLAGSQPPAREAQLQSPWRLDERLGDPRYASLQNLQVRLLAEETERLVDWQAVHGELAAAHRRFSFEKPETHDDEQLLAAVRRLGGQPRVRTLLDERSATMERDAWLHGYLMPALADSAATVGAALSQVTEESNGAIRAYVGSDENSVSKLFEVSERLRSKVSQDFDPSAATGDDGIGATACYFVESPLGPARIRAGLALFTSLQKDGIWLLTVPIIERGPELFVPEDVLDGAFLVSGPTPWRLEQTVEAARDFSRAAFARFAPMLSRYVEVIDKGADPFDPTVWDALPAFLTTSWTTAGSLIPARNHLAAVAVGDVIWILGGQLESPTDRVNMLDIETGTIRAGPPLTAPRMQFRAVAVDEAIYVLGGEISHHHSDTLETLVGREWIARAPMRTARSDFSAVLAADGAIYAIGGLSETGLLTTVERYWPGEDRWEEVAPLRHARRGFAIGADSRYVYVAGGQTNDSGGVYTDSLEVLDVFTGTWSDGPALPTSRAWCAGTVAQDGNFYVLGGHRESGSRRGYVKAVEAFDPRTWRWDRVDPLLVARASFASVASANSIFAVGGEGDGSLPVSVERLLLRRPDAE